MNGVQAPRRALVVCTRRLGDVLLATPLVRSMRLAWPQARIDMLVFRGTEAIVQANPDLNCVITVGERDAIGTRLASLAARWKRYDVACSTQTSDRATLLALTAGKQAVGQLDAAKRPGWKRALLDAWVPFDDVGTHTVVANLALCTPLGIAKQHEVVVAWSDRDAEAARRALGIAVDVEPLAVLHVSPKFAYKMWTLGGWGELAHWLAAHGLRPVVCGGGGQGERAYADLLRAHLPPRAIYAVGRLDLGALAALLARARVYVGTDTAVTHMAAAIGTPTVALFGPSNPVKWAPWPRGCSAEPSPWRMRGTQTSGNVFLVQGEGNCVPCREEGCQQHITSLSDCLQRMSATTVIAAVERALTAPGPH